MRVAAIVLRVLLAVLGGYALSAAASAGLTVALPKAGMGRSEAVVLAGMLAFLVYLGFLLWALSRRGRGPAPSFRQSMSVLHTWAGVVLGGVMFAIFWTGSLSVFDREIDRWMMPSTRLGPPPAALSLDTTARMTVAELAPHATQWSVTLPSVRTPTLQLRYQEAGKKSVSRHLDPATGAVLPQQGTLGASGFFFPFHFSLHLDWLDLGIWLVGLCAMAMLVLVVSGVLIHVHFFKEFFTFRPRKALSRSSLDLHTTLGVLALPFHFVMPLSGLIIFFSLFFPGTWQAAYGEDRGAFNREVFGGLQRPKANAPGELGSLDAMLAEAERLWGGGKPSFIRVMHPEDAASYVELRRSSADSVSLSRQQLYFDGATGALLGRFDAQPVASVQRFVAGLHFVQFESWTLRWFYFLGGLGGCVLTATGFLFWLESRRTHHERHGLRGVRVVEALTIGSVTGIVAASCAFFVANRWLPAEAAGMGLEREQLEMLAFYLTWLACFAHAAWRRRAAWAEQCWAIAALALACVGLNWWTTGDHLARAIGRDVYSVAGVDAMLLVCGLTSLATARYLNRAQRAVRAGSLGESVSLSGPARVSKRGAHG